MDKSLTSLDSANYLESLVNLLCINGISVHSYSTEIGIILDATEDGSPARIIPATLKAVQCEIAIQDSIHYLEPINAN